MSNEIELDKLVDAYLTIRGEREKLSRQYDEQDAQLREQQDKLEAVMLDRCNTLKADTVRTEKGTIIKNLREKFVCGDWDGFKRFVLDNQAIELLQQRISDTNLREYLSTREGEGLPPGISTMREYRVTVRKPSRK